MGATLGSHKVKRAKELYLGRPCSLVLVGRGSMTVAVDVKDARWSYGRVELLVAPVAGAGSAWVKELYVTDNSLSAFEDMAR